MKQVCSFFVLAMLLIGVLSTSSCSLLEDDEDDPVNPVLTPSTVSIKVDEEVTVAVDNGVAPYRLSGGYANIASVAVNGSIITVKGIQVGNSEVVVTGNDGGKDTLFIQVSKNLVMEEKDRYEEFVTPELEDVLIDELGVTINRGIHPPNITGFYRMDGNCTKSTIEGDDYVGRLINHFKMKFFNQNEIEVSLEAFEVKTGTNDFIAQHDANGTFICGEGNKFSVFFTEKVTSTTGTCTILSIFSGTLEKDGTGKVIGIKNFQNAFVMKDRNNVPDVIDNNEGRLFEDVYVDVISREAYETINNKPSVKRASVATKAASMLSVGKP